MTPERYARVVELFQQASDIAPDARAAFLVEACAGDGDLRRDVEAMLSADAQAGAFLEEPPNDIASAAMASIESGSRVGQMFGDYRVISRLGAGGMGEVYLAEDTRLGRKAALKLLPEEYAADPTWLRRFEQEARAVSALNHPNIVTIYGVGQSGAIHFLATEFVEGRTLREQMALGAIEPRVAIEIAIQAASALGAAHAARIIHRDIKPENIMLRPDGLVKVLDFGLAKHAGLEPGPADVSDLTTMPGLIMGTVRYMSPEQVRCQELDARTDLFSLGVVLYEMIARCPPFFGSTAGDVIAEILTAEPRALSQCSPDVPAELEGIAGKAIRKDKAERYQSAGDLAADLKALQRKLELGTGGAPVRRHARAAAVLAVLLLSIAGAMWWFAGRRGGGDMVQTLAVLPFVNLSNDPDVEYLSDGIRADLINNLSHLPQLRVTADASASRYKSGGDLSAVAKALSVRSVVTGRVAKRGDTLEVSAALMNARDQSQIWGNRYTGKASDLQTVQGEMARAIADKLRLRLTGAQERQLARPATPNPKAYELYLTGLFHGTKYDVKSRQKALDYYNQAIALDPRFAPAYASASAVYSFLGTVGAVAAKEASAKAKAAAQKAVELDPTLPAGHSELAVIAGNEWDWPGAEREFKRAIELNPSFATAHGNYALCLMILGRTPEALAENKLAQELDPLRLNYRSNAGSILYNARRYSEAIKVLEGVLQLQPDHGVTYGYFGYTYSAAGQYPQAITAFRKAISLIPPAGPSFQCYLGYVYAKMGRRNEALALLKNLKSNAEVSPAELAILYAGLGDRDGAFAALLRAYSAHDPQMQYLKIDPHYDGLRSDERFGILTRLVGLPQ